MRFRHRTSSGRLWTAITQASALAALALTGGCETKGFLDPTEMGRYKKDPLVMPIVSQVDPAVEEVDNQWATAQPPTADDLKPTTADYRISPNDLLAITLSDLNGPNTETVKQQRVSESGNISLPFLDQPIHAAGMTEIQLERTIIQAYHNAQLIEKAQVSVTVVEARGRAFKVSGAVTATGEYLIQETDFRLLDALVMARDVSSQFVQYIYVIRPIGEPEVMQQPPMTMPSGATTPNPSNPTSAPSSEELAPRSQANTPLDLQTSEAQPAATSVQGAVDTLKASPAAEPKKVILADQAPSAASFDGFHDPGPAPKVRVIRIPYEALKRGELQYNIAIRPRDTIYVAPPETGFYFVGGHVLRGGAFTLTGQKMTLEDAIISAGMLDGLAIPQRTDIIRHIAPDRKVYVRVDLEKIFAGEQPDIYIKPGDEITVGSNAIAPFLAAIRGGFRISYGLGFLYDINYAYPTTGGGFIP
ncbi:MAG TPA: polysaccharide biosynthesis/export family protein [Tepidisphaeraceae bacterium]|nr:polysaccharide biosynthesis/export family protein [Tepidisphaeraceae bacterium]